MTAHPARPARLAKPWVLMAERLEPRVLLAAQLVKDINTQPGYSSFLANPVVDGSVAFFGEHDGFHGDELWSTDGTADGTQLVKDINPGVGNSFPNHFATAGGITYFTATDGTSGLELWRTDGTPDGTYLVKDINPGPADSSPTSLTAVGSSLYFFADDGVDGQELWKSDGTADGTFMVVDTLPGSRGQGGIHHIAGTDDGTAFFVASDGTRSGLYATDGTPEGTTLITHLSGGLNALFADGNDLYYEDVVGAVYETDASRRQPVLLDATNSLATNFVDVNGTVFFARPDSIKQIDGNTVSTVGGSYRSAGSLVDVGGTLYFGANSANGTPQLWRYDPGDPAAVVVANNLPVFRTVDINGTLYIVAGSVDAGYTLYTSDGTAGGTTALGLINPGGNAPLPSGLVALGSQLLFANADNLTGSELWISDGTAAGTHVLKDIYPGTQPSFAFVDFSPLGNKLLLLANDGITGLELWASDGTSNGTIQLRDIGPGATGGRVSPPVVIGNRAYFSASDGTHGGELWVTDGTRSGTILLDDINPGSRDSSPYGFTELNGWVYFSADDGIHGTELWRTNGTAAGTQLVDDISPGSAASNPSQLTVLNGVLYFVATTPTTGAELWRSDGTAAGTSLVADVRPGAGDATITNLTAVNGALYFAATGDFASGNELWKSDGTAAGTVMLKDIAAGFADSKPSSFTAFGGEVYFAATDGTAGRELWKTDGTADGTVRVTDLDPGTASSSPFALTTLYGRLFFAADDATHQHRLWRTLGTPQSTAPVAGDLPLNVSIMTAIGGRLFMIADDGDGAGDELWTSDGTAAGTTRLQDLFPGAASGAGGLPVGLNGDVYVSGDDGVTGIEPFRFPDTFAPFVWDGKAVATGGAATLTFNFNEPVSGLSAAGLVVTNPATGAKVPTKSIGFSYDPQSDTATFTLPALPAGSYRAVLSAAGITDRAGNPLAQDQSLQFDLGTVSGSVFNDANHNGTRNVGEAGMSGVAVYLDLNGNGKNDAGEPLTTTDSNGNYVLSTTAAGAYGVREVVPSGWRRTAPLTGPPVVQVAAAQAATGPVFGNVLAAFVPLNFAYLLGLAQHYNSAGTFADGDLTGDDKVDFADLLVLAQNYNRTLPAARYLRQSTRSAR